MGPGECSHLIGAPDAFSPLLILGCTQPWLHGQIENVKRNVAPFR